MRRLKHVGYIVVAMLMVVALVLACAPTPEAPPVEELPPIKIGHLSELTGIAAGTGELFSEGIRLALDEVGWEVAGRKIELITEDSADSPDVAVDKTRKLAEVDKVDVIIGPLFSHSAAAVAGYLTPKKVMNIAEKSHGYEIAENESILVPAGPLIGRNVGLGHFAYEKFGARTATTIVADYVAGRRFAESFQLGFKEKGGAIVNELYFPIGTRDFMPYLAKIGNPDVLFYFVMSPSDAVLFAPQFVESGLEMPLVFGAADATDAVMPEIGEGILGMYGSSTYTWTIDNPTNKRFVEAFKKKYDGRLPDVFSAAGYRSVSVFLETVKATGGDTSYEKLMETAKALRFEAPQGITEFGPNRFGKPNVYIVKAVEIDGTYGWEEQEGYTYQNVVPKGWSPK